MQYEKITPINIHNLKVIRKIDDFLNNITMYRLVLYYLIALVAIASLLGLFGILPFSFFSIIFSALFLVLISWTTNTIFSKFLKVPTNVESVYITSLILALIISPAISLSDLFFLGSAAILAISSKYILTINKKHIFNPTAIAVVITAFAINKSASWWIGTLPMLPFVLIGGLLTVRKIRKFSMIFANLLSAFTLILVFSAMTGGNLVLTTQRIIFDSPILFFTFVMLTEPSTTPPTKKLQIIYGAIVGIFFTPQIHIGKIYSTPELSLLMGNIFSYLVSPKIKLILKLKEKIQTAPTVYDFIFSLNKRLSFNPGQYMEWTLPHSNPDNRGNRRYFTIASSPTEADLRIGVKYYQNSSSFKKALVSMDRKTDITAGQLAGDFVLPSNPSQKCVFIAGGIGITPFRSMVKYLLDINQKRDLVLFYSNKTENEIVYKDVFDKAQTELGIKTVYVLTDKQAVPQSWQGKTGRINERMIIEGVPDYKERIFYLSGPHAMVELFKDVLKKTGLPHGQIKVDFFPGFV